VRGRSKLTRAEREKRKAKHEHRARVTIPRRDRHRELTAQLLRASREYAVACLYPQGLRGERAVCEQCGLEQPRGEGLVLENGLVTVAPCENCGCDYAETVEAFAA
jgi:hypothetical protein